MLQATFNLSSDRNNAWEWSYGKHDEPECTGLNIVWVGTILDGIFWIAIIRVEILWVGIFQVELTWVGIFWVGVILGRNFPGGNLPGGSYPVLVCFFITVYYTKVRIFAIFQLQWRGFIKLFYSWQKFMILSMKERYLVSVENFLCYRSLLNFQLLPSSKALTKNYMNSYVSCYIQQWKLCHLRNVESLRSTVWNVLCDKKKILNRKRQYV